MANLIYDHFSREYNAMETSLVSFSGGMDSATLIMHEIVRGRRVWPVGFSYGSKHNSHEHQAAMLFLEHMLVKYPNHIIPPYKLVDLTQVMHGIESDLLKSGGEIPEGHYEAESMSQTVVPGRNTMFASILLGFAQSNEVDYVVMGIHSGDHAIYPDCRPEWYMNMAKVYSVASEKSVALQAPFLTWDKQKILDFGFYHEVPYELTRTCYKDQAVSCGKCGSCQERLEAFSNLGVQDPLDYQHRELLSK